MKRLRFVATSALALTLALSPMVDAVTGGGSALARTRGDPFCTEKMDNKELGQRIADALRDDPTGTKNRIRGCNVTPEKFFKAFQEEEKLHGTLDKAGLNVMSDLIQYVLDLKLFVIPTEDKYIEYQSACVQGETIVLRCVTRHLRRDEGIYQSRTGVNILMSDCINPGAVPWREIVVTASGPRYVKCVDIAVPVVEDTKSERLSLFVPAGVTISAESMKECLKVKYPHEDEFRDGMPTDCPYGQWQEVDGSTTKCTVTSIATSRGKEVYLQGGTVHTGTVGFLVWRLPAEVADPALGIEAFVCPEEREVVDGRLIIRHLNGVIVDAADFQGRASNGLRQVVIPYEAFLKPPGSFTQATVE